ncbi:ParA family protein [Longimicrobium sp.]|uniref:ParA family protein n=1 Tax=Longimicrobium sp. TaxID=2029185 RepID=UPI002E3315AA|nr:ParA family protein [Longimicrobium sp.]HEX6038316.1 ParA family protein [Longimicrobium sp.]
MAAVISVINLKGGVGKTTTTVAVAQVLAGTYGRRVLVVDLDPQTNATVMLIGERGWQEVNARERTVAHLFRRALRGTPPGDVAESILPDVGSVGEVRGLALLPSSLELIEVQEQLSSMPRRASFSVSPAEVLRHALAPVLDAFDYVLIDCPPSLGLVTFNGLRISHGFIMPTIPDVLSTYGIPQIMRRVRLFADAFEMHVEPLGIVVNKFRQQSTVHAAQLHALAARAPAPLFRTVIPENNDVAGAAEFRPVSTLRQKWGYRTYEAYRDLTAEIVEKVEHGR